MASTDITRKEGPPGKGGIHPLKNDLGYQVTSLRKLGAILGRSHVAVRKWLSHVAWPKDVPRRPPWTAEQAETLRAWAGATLRPDRAITGPDAMTSAGTSYVRLSDAIEAMGDTPVDLDDPDILRRLGRAGVSLQG